MKVPAAALNAGLDLRTPGPCLGHREVVLGGDQRQSCVGQELCRSMCPGALGLSQKQETTGPCREFLAFHAILMDDTQMLLYVFFCTAV